MVNNSQWYNNLQWYKEGIEQHRKFLSELVNLTMLNKNMVDKIEKSGEEMSKEEIENIFKQLDYNFDEFIHIVESATPIELDDDDDGEEYVK